MQITSLKANKTIPFSDVLSEILRFDLLPVPLSFEFSVKMTDEYMSLFAEGNEILVGDIDAPLIIIKSQPLKTQTIKNGERIGAIACVAILSGMENLIKSTNKAIIQNATSFNAVVRACGCKLSLNAGVPLAKFVCLKGVIPTYCIATALQKEACVFGFIGGKVSVIKIDDLFKKDASMTLDDSAIAWINSQVIVDIHRNAYVGIDKDGSTVLGSSGSTSGIGVVQKAGLTSRELKNMSKVLVTRGTIVRPLDTNIKAGDLVKIGEKSYVILTVAHRFDTGALGGSSVTATKIWIASL